VFKWWFTFQLSDNVTLAAGEVPSTEGIEIGFD
jgi:hypothetical protein